MKGLSEEYWIETKVSVKKGVKLRKVKESSPHPMRGARMNYNVRVCPHDYVHPGDIPFTETKDNTLCPWGCFVVTRQGRRND